MSPSPPPADAPPDVRGVRRATTLWRLFRNEKADPEPFYSLLAREAAADLDRRHGPLAGQVVADLGSGPGYYSRELRRLGAVVVAVEGDLAELGPDGSLAAGSAVGDAGRLPLPDASLDGVFCSNMLEHAPDTAAVVAEFERVLRPGGWGYLSWTNWYSPWGGHDMTPYQYLGPNIGPRLYERRHGPPRKNRFGEGLFAVHIGPTLALFEDRAGLVVDRVEPRYWPWAAVITRVPGAREVLSWNCVIRFHRSTGAGPAGGFDAALATVEPIEGWMTDGQARRLWDRAAALSPPQRIVEIGSYRGRSTVLLARAAAAGVEVVAIDPHGGDDRGPGQWHGTSEEGEADREAFLANLARAGVAARVRSVRRPSQEAFDDVDGDVALLYVDGAHRYRPAVADIRRWGARVAPGGTMLVHDAFSSVGVTLAILRALVASGRFRYAGRTGSLAEYRRVEGLSPRQRAASAARQVVQLPWFARNLAVKGLIVARLGPLTRVLGHHGSDFPY